MPDTTKMSYVLAVNALVNKLLDLQEQQQKQINNLLQEINDYSVWLERQSLELMKGTE